MRATTRSVPYRTLTWPRRTLNARPPASSAGGRTARLRQLEVSDECSSHGRDRRPGYVPGGGVLLTGSPAALAADSQTGCSTGALPTAVLGSPGVKAQQREGVYLWHGPHGYSLRFTHPGKARVIASGVVTVSRDVSQVKRVALERDDVVRVSDHGRALAFRFTNFGGLDGVDFAAECSKTVHVSLRIATREATPNQVFLGKDRTSPTSVPFTIERAHDTQPARIS